MAELVMLSTFDLAGKMNQALRPQKAKLQNTQLTELNQSKWWAYAQCSDNYKSEIPSRHEVVQPKTNSKCNNCFVVYNL